MNNEYAWVFSFVIEGQVPIMPVSLRSVLPPYSLKRGIGVSKISGVAGKMLQVTESSNLMVHDPGEIPTAIP